MLTKMRRRLTLLYTSTTSLILTVILLIVWIYQGHLESGRLENTFQNYLLELTNKLETDSNFSDTWLAQMESGNHLIIHIEDNGQPLFFDGAWSPSTNRSILIKQAKIIAQKQNINTDHEPLFQHMKKTSLFSFKGQNRDRYVGIILILTGTSGYKTLVLLQDVTDLYRSNLIHGLLFLLVDGAGILALAAVSRYVLKKALAPVAEYQQRQTEFVAAASHELRSPLSVIQTSAAAIELEPDKTSDMVQAIQRECQRAGNLIKNLLLLASSDSKAVQVPLTPVEADTLMLQLYESYEPVCREKGIRLNLHMPDELLPEVLSDSGYLYQILTILLDNALAYGCQADSANISASKKETACSILLSASLDHNHLILSVIDHGPGIPDDEKEKVFRRFYREDSSRSRKDHFGLGLSVAASLAPMAAAAITLNDTPGGGASFHITLTCLPV